MRKPRSMLSYSGYIKAAFAVGFVYFTILSLHRLNEKAEEGMTANRLLALHRDDLRKLEARHQELKQNLQNEEQHHTVKEAEGQEWKDKVKNLEEALANLETKLAEEKEKNNGKTYQFPLHAEGNPPNYRVQAVRQTIKSVWGAYRENAMGADEINPITNKRIMWDNVNKQMVTLVDSLDTLYISGCREEFHEAVEFLAENFDFNPPGNVALFETTIRVLGGLLSAYALSNDPRVLAKAVQVGDIMIPAYGKEELAKHGGVPQHAWNHKMQQSSYGFGTYLAEAGSVQMEYRYLSQAAKNLTYDEDAMRVYQVFHDNTRNGLVGNTFNGKSFTGAVNTGSYSDSYYEYLLKMHLLTGQNEGMFKDMYMEAAESILKNLVKPIPDSTQSYIVDGSLQADGNVTTSSASFEHLSCFVPGMLALGSLYIQDPLTKQRHLKAAESIGDFCAHLYLDTQTGLSPDLVSLNGGKKNIARRNYGLRPETVESLFYLWRVTRKQKYRDWGWKIYLSIEKYCKVCPECEHSGYSEISDVTSSKPSHTGHMDTFFTGETLKYLYLLFAEDAALDLDCWVLNTEAHPFPKFMPFHTPGGSDHTPLPHKCSNPPSPY